MNIPEPPAIATTPDRTADTAAGDDVLQQMFATDSLVLLRNTVAAHASGLGVDDLRVADLVLVAYELAANAVRHGGGTGTLRLWRTGTDQIICQVTDPGPAPDDLAQQGLHPQSPSQLGGRGIWLIRQFTHALDIQTGPGETRITATFDLHRPPPVRQPKQAWS